MRRSRFESALELMGYISQNPHWPLSRYMTALRLNNAYGFKQVYHLIKQGFIVKRGKYGYFLSPKGEAWRRGLTDLLEQFNGKEVER